LPRGSSLCTLFENSPICHRAFLLASHPKKHFPREPIRLRATNFGSPALNRELRLPAFCFAASTATRTNTSAWVPLQASSSTTCLSILSSRAAAFFFLAFAQKQSLQRCFSYSIFSFLALIFPVFERPRKAEQSPETIFTRLCFHWALLAIWVLSTSCQDTLPRRRDGWTFFPSPLLSPRLVFFFFCFFLFFVPSLVYLVLGLFRFHLLFRPIFSRYLWQVSAASAGLCTKQIDCVSHEARASRFSFVTEGCQELG